MADLTKGKVKALGHAVGLEIQDPELTEVTYNLNALLEALDEIGYDGAVAVHQGPLEGESIEHCYRSCYDYLTKIGNFAPRSSATA